MSRGVFDDPEARARVVELLRGGATMAEAAGAFGVTRKTLHKASRDRLDWLAEIDEARGLGHGPRSIRKFAPARDEVPEVVDGEVVDNPGWASEGSPMGLDELILIASNVARNPDHRHWPHAVKVLQRVHIDPHVFARMAEIKRELEQAPTGEIRRVVVLRIPIEAPGAAGADS